MISVIPLASAETTVSIYTEKEVYNYGDFLVFTIEIPEIKEDFAILHIIDESGLRSSAIPLSISDLKSVIPSSYAFEPEIYPEGKYKLELQYSGELATAKFELVDAGNIVIPFHIKEFSKYWYNGDTTDEGFMIVIQFLIDEKMIEITQETSKEGNSVVIPKWFKIPTGWWIDGKVSDQEFAESVEFLINAGIFEV